MVGDFLSLLREELQGHNLEDQAESDSRRRLWRWHLYGELPEGQTDSPYPVVCPACGQPTQFGCMTEGGGCPSVWCANAKCPAGVLWVDSLEMVEAEDPDLHRLLATHIRLQERLEAERVKYRAGYRSSALQAITQLLGEAGVDTQVVHEYVLQVITKRPICS